MERPVPMESASASIDDKIKELDDWRGKMLAKVRALIHAALQDPEGLFNASLIQRPFTGGSWPKQW